MATTALTDVQSRARSRRHLRETLEGYLWASPWLIGFVVFIAGPMLASVGLSFSLYDLSRPPRFIGLDNFQELVSDPRVPKTMLTTTIFALATVPANLLIGLGLALLVNMKIRGIGVWRTLYYLPAITPAVAYAQLWIWLFNKDFGLINAFLALFGISGPGWLVDPSWVLPSLIVMTFWGVGGSMIINLAGLQGIPTHLYEAAEIDGAGGFAKFWHITVPMMSPVVFYNLVIGVIGALQAFTIIFIVTGGKEDGMTFMVYLYKQAFGMLRMGYGSAMAWLLFLYIMVWTLLIFRSGRSWVYYEGQLRGR